jgi:hypothetical protein
MIMKTLVKNSIPSILDELFNDRFVKNQRLSNTVTVRFSKAAFNVKENVLSLNRFTKKSRKARQELAKHAKF